MSTSTTDGTTPQVGEGTATDVSALQDQLNAVIAERDTLKTQHRDLKNASKGVSDLQKQYDALMAKHSTLEEEYGTFKTSLKQKATDSYLETALNAAGAHNAARVKAMLDMSKLKIADDGTPDQASVAEAIKAIKTSDSYMFKPEGGADTGNDQNSGGTSNSVLPEVKRAAEGQKTDAFKLALEAAKKDKKDPYAAIQAVLTKFGK
jgi:chaperonin cofactor prefoldin